MTEGPDDRRGPDGQAALEGLLREVRRQAATGTGSGVRGVLDWLHRQTGAGAALLAPDTEGTRDPAGTEVTPAPEASTPDFPPEVLPPLAPLLARLRDGRLATAATEAAGLHVRCEALGSGVPHPVLVVASPAEPARATAALASHAGSVLTLLSLAGEGDRTSRRYQDKARQLRLAVLHALLAGEPVLARRMTSGAVPPLLDAERLRVYLLRCPPSDRDRITRAHQDPSGYQGPDLMVHCPVFKDHLICLVTDDGGGGVDDGGDGSDGVADGGPGGAYGLGPALRRLVRAHPRYALGVSGAHPLAATAEAYGQAAHALAAAHTADGRVGYYHGRTPLEAVLPRQRAHDWARALLRPLDGAPRTSAEITRMAMSMPRSGVAGLLGLSRNTVAAHIRRAEDVLGLDLADVRNRAAVHLALALSGASPAPEGAAPEGAEPEGPAPDGPVTGHAGPDRPERPGNGRHRPPPALDELLVGEAPGAWARAALRPLDARHQRTLHAWIDANADAQRTARRLGISRNTVRAHLRGAEAALGLDLLTHGTGIHTVVLALRIADAPYGGGSVDPPAPAPAPR
ncbi:helix-turn-helix domain-containing protein [Streptomyces sp. Z26]|uniref:helix-turn-helix domain-containing protein n=1 Tax=Streptomyces sp. Z26 TaxID=2500177 RepID=UPI001F0BDF6C|nr:helix-turn-helix domain-containing protein [Streptomyces sp. Z26]